MSGRVAFLTPWLLPLALLIVWETSARLGWLDGQILPSPEEVITALFGLLRSGELAQHVAVSAARALSGFVVGGSLGFALGLCNGWMSWAERLLDTSLQMLRNIPHLALLPLLILWFGIGEETKILLVVLGVFFPVYVNTLMGLKTVDPQLVEMARSYGLSGYGLFRDVLFPGALPSILVGVRYALGIMWITLIVAETVASSSGIGYLAMNAREFMQTDVVVLSILIYALLGKLADWAAHGLERRLLAWHPAYRR
ncbi:aliphatic sulfonate ABC transporter permease SsuC [Methylococcus sp. EFPC2]|uniref:aliphatic sulfonate ABC transporter permease SsuC n=1 Tax=Methylococcus sp. EFPC2 TaxID=2812648 RepID=UPI00196822D2|nr:aliphatic sulfonate ABC transporter permease SsuC [Methylococcus sp. EFPC2]QSA96119.1 aliphatic sulfonate ABC transporter permease SsuC [Methylococcus sp. EFPC2]